MLMAGRRHRTSASGRQRQEEVPGTDVVHLLFCERLRVPSLPPPMITPWAKLSPLMVCTSNGKVLLRVESTHTKPTMNRSVGTLNVFRKSSFDRAETP
jgi:hypothetical protein